MRYCFKAALALSLCLLLSLSALGALPRELIPGGNTIGLELDTQGLSVVEVRSPAAEKAGICKGDVLQKIDGRPILTPQDVAAAVKNSKGAALRLTLLQDGQEKTCNLAPQKTEQGWQLGLLVRQGISGIGTVTYYNTEDGSFGALGHGVSDGKALMPLRKGSALPSQVVSVTKGKKGEPGALQGAVTGRTPLGEIHKNTHCGIFGSMLCPQKQALPVADWREIHRGKATILSNVRGTQVREYSVKILEISPHDRLSRNLLLEVTDPALLESTGGIVQGMSGSPILQDGKLVGAVTHVLVDDPTTGYGIFIENMLDAAA